MKTEKAMPEDKEQASKEGDLRPYRVYAIEYGTVIDHIPHGKALKALEVLGLTTKTTEHIMTVGMNLESKKHGHKDVVKIEGKELTDKEVNKLAMLAPTATINIIRNHSVFKKMTVEVPKEIVGILRCSNPNCITNHLTTPTKFVSIKKHPLTIKCWYCERAMVGDEIQF